jgi:hypothetical protein
MSDTVHKVDQDLIMIERELDQLSRLAKTLDSRP